jgi:hypothetical protein
MVAWSLSAAADMPPLNLHEAMLALIHLTTARHAVYAEELRAQYAADGAGGLVGATWAVGRGGESVQSGEQLRGLARLEGDERDKLARYLKDAHAMGIATQAIELAQGQAEIVTVAFRGALDAAGAELVPAVRGVIVQAFLERLGRGELVAGEVVEP